MRPFVIILVSLLMVLGAFGQVASISDPGQLSYTATARGGQHMGFSAAGVAGNVGVFARSLGSAWDVGAEGLIYRGEVQSGGALSLLDLGATAIYGSAGGKLAGEAGIVVGDSSNCMLWAKGILGNFQALTAGAQVGRVSLSGAYGNYFENRGDVGVNLDRAGHYVVTGGWSSSLGWNGGLRITFVRKK